MTDKVLFRRDKLKEIRDMLPEGEARDRVENLMYGITGPDLEDWKHPKNTNVIMYGDDGEGFLNIHKADDSDIWFTLHTTDEASSIRHRTSGSSLSMDVRVEITKTLNYLMYLLENGYEEEVEAHCKKIIGERMVGKR